MGSIVGQSDHQAARPITTPYTAAHLMNTILRTVLDVGQVRLRSELPRGLVKSLEDGQPIVELMG